MCDSLSKNQPCSYVLTKISVHFITQAYSCTQQLDRYLHICQPIKIAYYSNGRIIPTMIETVALMEEWHRSRLKVSHKY